MPKYNHMIDIAFEVISDKEDGSDITPTMLKAALLRRITSLDETPEQNEWKHATSICDTHEVGK